MKIRSMGKASAIPVRKKSTSCSLRSAETKLLDNAATLRHNTRHSQKKVRFLLPCEFTKYTDTRFSHKVIWG